MGILEIITTLSVGLMIGNEVAVSAFINPALWAKGDTGLTSLLARNLGKVMPFWYALCLVLLATEAFRHRGMVGWGPLVGAAAVWAAIIVYTVTVLVPINNRLATQGDSLPGQEFWRQHRRWDWLHRVRVALLIVSFVMFLAAI